MSTRTTKQTTSPIAPRWVSRLLWLLAAASVLSHLTSMLLHLPQATGGVVLAGSLMLFGLFHGASTYGWRGIAFFIVVCLGVSNAFENLSILTGFPFGWYHYGDKMGPRLFLVPLLIGPLYFGVGYLSRTLARAILGDTNGGLGGRLVYATPIVASFIVVCWDLTIDPKMSTITSNWIRRDGGSYFGVPLANFLGWYLTVYVFLLAFACSASVRCTRLHSRLLGETFACLLLDRDCTDLEPDAEFRIGRGIGRDRTRVATKGHSDRDRAGGNFHGTAVLVAGTIQSFAS